MDQRRDKEAFSGLLVVWHVRTTTKQDYIAQSFVPEAAITEWRCLRIIPVLMVQLCSGLGQIKPVKNFFPPPAAYRHMEISENDVLHPVTGYSFQINNIAAVRLYELSII